MIKKILYFSPLFAGLVLIGYFIGHSTSNENDASDVFSMQQKCSEAGARLYEKDLESRESTGFSLGGPQYHYNRELNTCLYYNTVIGVGQDFSNKWVMDSFSNKELVSFIATNGKPFLNKSMCDTCVTNEEFEIKKEALFSQ